MPSTTEEQEGIRIEEVSEGVSVKEDTRNSEYTYWWVRRGEEPMTVDVCQVTLNHPRIDTYNHNQPITRGKIIIGRIGYSYNSNLEIPPNVAEGLVYVLSAAEKLHEEKMEELKPQVAEKLKEIEEREKKREEVAEAREKIAEKIDALEMEWLKESAEILNWLEGQAGRLKRKGKKGFDVFHELQALSATRDWIQWMWSNQMFSDRLSNVKIIQIRYAGERDYVTVEGLPEYPQAEIQKLREEMLSIRSIY